MTSDLAFVKTACIRLWLRYPRGYYKLWEDHVEQGDTGYDFDFMKGRGGSPEPEIE